MDIGRVTAAPESVKFAIRKLEDMLSLESAALSGATELSGVSSELRSIQNMLGQFHRVLMNAQPNWEDSQKNDPNVNNCTIELQDVAKCTETAILIFMNEVQGIKSGTIPDKLKKINPKPVNFFALHKLKDDVQKIKSQVRTINIKDLGAFSDRAITQSARPSLRNIDDIWLLCLEIYRKCILRRLIDQSLQTRSVVKVVGTQVFAKMVLAEKIYQSTEVKSHFEACFWLFPQIRLDTHTYLFKPIDILRKMLLKLGDTNSLDAHDEDYQIMSRLRQSLNRKRCLVIVDNNWTELWTLVNAVFPNGNNGSRVLITTKEQGQSDYKYELPSLKCQDSLKLLNELGKPVYLGSQLPFDLPQNDKTLSNRVDVNQCYSTLPSVLKTCIAYTAAVFPCGNIILADSLIRLWIVEGFIPLEEGRTMENIAESYLDQLVQRGLLRIIGAYYHNQANHPIRSIILHPNLHNDINSAALENINSTYRDTAADENKLLPVTVILSVDAFDSYNYPQGTDKNLVNLHRLALHLPCQFNCISSLGKGTKPQLVHYPSLHSLFFFGYVTPVANYQFSFLQVLAVFSSYIQFPEEYTPCWLDGLINLRYLGFIVCLVEGGSLGKTLDSLRKLEILDLSASIVSGLSEFIKNNKKLNVVGFDEKEFRETWSPIPDMSQ